MPCWCGLAWLCSALLLCFSFSFLFILFPVRKAKETTTQRGEVEAMAMVSLLRPRSLCFQQGDDAAPIATADKKVEGQRGPVHEYAGASVPISQTGMVRGCPATLHRATKHLGSRSAEFTPGSAVPIPLPPSSIVVVVVPAPSSSVFFHSSLRPAAPPAPP